MLEPRRFTVEEVTRGLLVERAMRGVEQLRRAALAAEEEFGVELGLTAPELRESAFNLIHYLAVRRHDVRPLQDDLSRLGLSSLGRMEAHVLATLNAVLAALYALRGQPLPDEIQIPPSINFDTGDAILAEHADAILGPCSEGNMTRIMVTMPSEAADDPELIRDLVAGGMQVARINCAHDSSLVWERMLKHLRRAERETGRTCRVSFDLAGPKLRTGEIASGPEVAKRRPQRDRLGIVVEPARVRFVSQVDDAEQDKPRRVRDAEQGSLHPGNASLPAGCPLAHAVPSAEEIRPVEKASDLALGRDPPEARDHGPRNGRELTAQRGLSAPPPRPSLVRWGSHR